MNQIHRSSSGCHVALGDVAPGNPVSNETERSTLTINEQRCLSLSSRCHVTNSNVVPGVFPFHRCSRRLLLVVVTVHYWW
jgi:hypothetical protein